MPLSVGQRAPDFDVTASNGKQVKLSGSFRGKKNIVLFFYPADFTSVCTKEACGFQDMYKDLSGKDTEVVGVSVDSDDSHARFAKEHNLDFPLIADTNMKLAKDYAVMEGVFGAIGKLIGRIRRVTYVIDKKGEIAGVFESEIDAEKHTGGVRKLVESLA